MLKLSVKALKHSFFARWVSKGMSETEHTRVESQLHSDHPVWAQGLKKSGLYYEGFVTTLEETLEAHRKCTLTTYGTRTSKRSPISTGVCKENDSALANKQVRL